MPKLQYSTILFIVGLFVGFFFIYWPMWEAIGLAMTSLFVINFFYFSHSLFDIRHLILVVVSVQWVLGSLLSYELVPKSNVYAMKVPAIQYFSLAVPGVLFYAAGLLLPINYPRINKKNLINKINRIRIKSKNLDIILVITGLLFSIFNKMAPVSLRFIVFLLSGIQFVGLIMLLTNPYRKNKKLILVIAGVFLIISGIIQGGFGLIFTWLIASYVIYSYFIKVSIPQIIILGGIAILLAFVMQGVKMQYRAITWMGGTEYSVIEKLELFQKLVNEKPEINDDETEKSVVSRMNQGWIISEIIKNMEIYHAEFLNGETIQRTFLSVILPGSIYEEKLKAGGQEYFTRFTGRRIGETTSMNISVLGEAYGNYGRTGAFVFMFLFGLFLNISFLLILKTIIKYPLIIFFIPMMFQQVIKAEGDFFIVLNHLVKSSVFVFLIYFSLSKFGLIKT